MNKVSLIRGGAELEFGAEAQDVKLYAFGKPHDFKPFPPPGTHGEALNNENFFTAGIRRAEVLCGGATIMMRVGFVLDRIATLNDPYRWIPGTRSIRLGNESTKADIFRLDRQDAVALNIRSVGFNAADSGFCQIAVFVGEYWTHSYFVHGAFYNFAPKNNPLGASLIEMVARDVYNGSRSSSIKIYYGFGICPAWYGVGDDYASHLTARYGSDSKYALQSSPTCGPRMSSSASVSLKAMLKLELRRTSIWSDLKCETFLTEGLDSCPAAMRDASGKLVLWSAVRESDESLNPPGNPGARNYIFYSLPRM